MDIKNNVYMYLVHSYYAELCEETIAQTNFGITYSSALKKDNFYRSNSIQKRVVLGEKEYYTIF